MDGKNILLGVAKDHEYFFKKEKEKKDQEKEQEQEVKEQEVWKIKKPGDISHEQLLKPSETCKPENDSKKTKNSKRLHNQLRKPCWKKKRKKTRIYRSSQFY